MLALGSDCYGEQCRQHGLNGHGAIVDQLVTGLSVAADFLNVPFDLLESRVGLGQSGIFRRASCSQAASKGGITDASSGSGKLIKGRPVTTRRGHGHNCDHFAQT